MTPKIPAIYRDGNVVMDHAADWPEGARIEVCLVEPQSPPADDLEALACALNDQNSCGLDESLWPKTREGIELLAAHMKAAEPLELTPEQRQRIDDERKANRQLQKELTRDNWSELEETF